MMLAYIWQAVTNNGGLLDSPLFVYMVTGRTPFLLVVLLRSIPRKFSQYCGLNDLA